MKEVLHVLHIEDSLEDGELVHRLLEAQGLRCTIKRVETRNQMLEALQEPNCDLILSDCSLPRFRGLEALQIARAMRPEIPFIFVSGTMGEETAIESLQNGATDYVLKQRLSRLVPAVRRALTEADNRNVRRALEGQVRQAQRLETVGSFMGGLAHDFRNLLQIQKLSIDLLTMVANEPDHVIEIAGKLSNATERGCMMVQELLAFARKTESNLVPLDMATQINEVARMLQSSLPAGVTLTLELEEDLPAILADGGQVDRMVTNLIFNARDAMPEGGEIVVSIDLIRFAGGFTKSWQINDAPYLRVGISDTGTGMDEATQSHIFEPFFTTKPEGEGTGLGLSVVFGLMEAHQGFIDLDSKVGEGTTFALFFPLSPGTNVSSDRIQNISPIHLLGKTVQPEISAV